MDNDTINLQKKFNRIFKFIGNFPINRKLATIIIITKFFPLLIISHDWRIKKNFGISYYLRKFTLSEIIFDLNNFLLFYIILYSCFLMIIITLFSLIRVILFNKKIICSSFLKYSNIFLYISNQYLYSIFTEIIFNSSLKKKLSNSIYILSIIIITLCLIYIIILDLILSSVLLKEPSFIGNNSILTNEIGKLDLLTFSFSLLQIIVQIEFNVKEKYIIMIKSGIRLLIFVITIIYFFDHSFYYYKIEIEFSIKFYIFLCFSSILIEFFSLREYYNNKYFIFQEDKSILVIKIFIEIILAIIITFIYFKIEFKIMKRDFSNFNYNIFGTYNNNIIKVFNLIYFLDKPNEIKKILNNLNLTFKSKVHIPKCKKEEKNCFFCHDYDYFKFEKEIKNLHYLMKENIKQEIKINLKEDCSTLFLYFSKGFENIQFMNINHSRKFYSAVLILITFYYAFEKEYFKCLYLIESINFNQKIKKSFIKCLQIYILKIRILDFYKKEKKNKIEHYSNIKKEEEEEIKNIYKFTKNFDSVNKILKIEKKIKNILKSFQNIMKLFNEENIDFNKYSLLIRRFCENYEKDFKKLIIQFNKMKCSIIYPIKKISVPFDFLISEIPKEIIKPMNKFFSNQISLIDDEKLNYIITINIIFLNNKFNFLINYVSDELIQKLNYNKNELYLFNFIDLFPKSFSKSYSYILYNSLKKGIEYFQIKKLCLKDKFNYISLFDFKSISLSTKKGIKLYFQLKNSKEEKIIEKKKSLNKKDKNNNLTGTCFLYTNKVGRINNISRGFEDYFFLNTNVLSQYKIYITDLFNISKLKKKGNFEIDLNLVFNNINNIFNKEIGQISEDEFSKIIIKLRTFEETLSNIKFNFVVSGNFEQRKLEIPNKKDKILYIFCVFIKLKEIKTQFQETNILCLENLINQNYENLNLKNTKITENTSFSYLEEISSTPQIFDKESRFWFLIKKMKNINKIFIVLLKKFFKISINNKKENLIAIDDENKIKEQEDKDIINYNEMSKKNLKGSFMIKINEYNIYQKYFSYLILISFYIILIILFIFKIKEIINLKIYIESFTLGNMYIQTVNQIILKVLQLQFISNGILKEKKNTFEYNINQLNYLFEKNIIYMNKYISFLTDNFQGRKYILPNFDKFGNYTLPLINGTKFYSNIQIFRCNIHVMLNSILLNGEIPIIYNNSNYYFNESMIKKFNYSRIEYYDKSLSYIEFLENFSLYFTFILSENQNIFLQIIINEEISFQKKLSFIILIIDLSFSIFYLIEIFLFYKKTLFLFSNYFLGFIRLRFFNNYINSKINLIIDYIDNYPKYKKINEKMEEIEIIQNNFEELILKNIINEQYDKMKLIKIQPFNIKTYITYDNIFKDVEKDILENRNELFELSKNFAESRVVNSPRLFNILKKQSSFNFSIKKKNSILSQNINLNLNSSRNSLPLKNSNLLKKKDNNHFKERKSIFHNLKENRESTNSNINKSTNSNHNNSNISISKSNIHLINNSSSRANFTQKSSLKLLNEDSKNNLSQNKSFKNQIIRNRNFIEKDNNIFSNGKNLLEKPNLYFNFITFLFIMIIINIIISSIQILLSINSINNTKSMVKIQHNIFLFLKYNVQIVFFYGLTVLKNEPLIFNYQINKYTSDCSNNNLILNLNHNIFIETQFCYLKIKKDLENILSWKINYKSKNLKEVNQKIYSNDFCKFYSEFFIINKNYSEIKELSYLNNLTYIQLYNECINVGNGINLKGYNNAIESIYQTLISYYEEFINKNNRSEEYNFLKINDFFFQSSLIENSEITKKISIIYFIAFKKDFKSFRKTIVLIESVIFFFQIFIMIIISIIYIIYLKKFEREIEKVIFFNKCLINSILYK